MFRCPSCGEVAPPRTPATFVIVELRARRYPERRYRVRGDKKERIDRGGEGTEIVRAVWVCGPCASSP